jgi:hypothetical protein
MHPKELFALLGALAALIAILGPLAAFIIRYPHRRRVRRFRKRILRFKRLRSKGRQNPSIITQGLSDLLNEIENAFAMGKITEEESNALNALAKK